MINIIIIIITKYERQRFKHKRNYNEMLNYINSLSNSLSNSINHLPIPKIKYNNFLNDNIISKDEIKFLNILQD